MTTFWMIQQYNMNAKRKRFKTEKEARDRAANHGGEWSILRCQVVEVVKTHPEKQTGEVK